MGFLRGDDPDSHASSCPRRSKDRKPGDRCNCTIETLRDSLRAARHVIAREQEAARQRRERPMTIRDGALRVGKDR